MPIEIRELVIRTVIGGDAPAPTPQQDTTAAPPQLGGLSFDQLVQECVRQVMQALARERER